MLDRVLVVVNYDGSLRLSGHNVYKIDQVLPLEQHFPQMKAEHLKYHKHDYVMSYSAFQGLWAVQQYQKTGLKVETLDNQVIYPRYGVYTPTNQRYLYLLDKYIHTHPTLLDKQDVGVDLGCGTGVLGLMVLHSQNNAGQMLGIDHQYNSVVQSQINAQLLGIHQYQAKQLDLVHFMQHDTLYRQQAMQQMQMSTHYQLVIANPPWLVAQTMPSYSQIENAVYDPNEAFLIATFKFSEQYLKNSAQIKKKGKLLLIYSDLSENIGLQAKNRIESLCEQHGMMINTTSHIPFQHNKNNLDNKIDPLIKIKQSSKVILYEIVKL